MFGFPSLITPAHAAETTAAGGAGGGSMWYTLIMLGALVLIFYFLILRPQRKRDKDSKNMRESLSVGDEVVTIGGVCGKITRIKEDTITLQSGDSKLRFLKNSIASVTKPAASKDDEEDSGEEKSE